MAQCSSQDVQRSRESGICALIIGTVAHHNGLETRLYEHLVVNTNQLLSPVATYIVYSSPTFHRGV
jgi:hypothetical protein